MIGLGLDGYDPDSGHEAAAAYIAKASFFKLIVK